jgi:hypothetical protein
MIPIFEDFDVEMISKLRKGIGYMSPKTGCCKVYILESKDLVIFRFYQYLDNHVIQVF